MKMLKLLMDAHFLMKIRTALGFRGSAKPRAAKRLHHWCPRSKSAKHTSIRHALCRRRGDVKRSQLVLNKSSRDLAQQTSMEKYAFGQVKTVMT